MGIKEHQQYHQEIVVKGLKEWYADPKNMEKVKAKFRISGKKVFEKYPEIYQKGNLKAIEISKSPEGREFLRKMRKEQWASLTIKEKQQVIKNMKEASTPKNRELKSKAISQSWEEGKLKPATHKPWLGILGKKYSEESKLLQSVGRGYESLF
jgi:uncharacterized protein YeaC (DUF1315 family)